MESYSVLITKVPGGAQPVISNGETVAELFAKANIDGGLVGGASLKAEFGNIVNY